MVSEEFEDWEGEVLRRVRRAVGEGVPLVISLDYHANVTPDMVRFSDAMVAYRTYPHVDRIETGVLAARAMARVLERGRPAGRALRKLPFLIPLNDQCTLVEPSRSIVKRSVVGDGELLSLSYLAGFPPSDLYWCGPAVIAHADTQEAANRAADGLARELALREPEFAVPMVSVDEGIREAMRLARSASKPVSCSVTRRTIRAAVRRRTPPACLNDWWRSAPNVRWLATSAIPRRQKRHTLPVKARSFRWRSAGVRVRTA